MTDTGTDDNQGTLWQRIWPQTKWLRPSLLALVALCFFLPFIAVSCDAPGGFGRVDSGGTTSYTGFDLAFGGEPTRSPDQLLPDGKGVSDLIGLQPAALIGLVLLAATLVCALAIRRPAARNVTVAALTLATALTLGIAQLLAHATLSTMLAEQLTSQNLPQDAVAGDYVRVGVGFTAAMIGLGLIVLGEFILISMRMRNLKGQGEAPPGEEPPQDHLIAQDHLIGGADPLLSASDMPGMDDVAAIVEPPPKPPEEGGPPPDEIVPGTGPGGILPEHPADEADPEPEPRRATGTAPGSGEG